MLNQTSYISNKAHTPRDVREIANAILDIADDGGIRLTNLSLNKIAFFAHAWFLAIYTRPLINSYFQAWQYGPVHPQIYNQMKHYGAKPIATRLTRIEMETGEDIPFEVNLTLDEHTHLKNMTHFYGARSAGWLVNVAHDAGSPWEQVWLAATKKACPGMVIPDALIEVFYRNKLEKHT